MFKWLEEPMTRLGEVEDWAGVQDSVAVFDATNSTRKRRDKIKLACKARKKHPVGLVFVESLCDDEGLLEDNFRLKVRNSPDFEGMTEEEAMKDLKIRVKNYEEVRAGERKRVVTGARKLSAHTSNTIRRFTSPLTTTTLPTSKFTTSPARLWPTTFSEGLARPSYPASWPGTSGLGRSGSVGLGRRRSTPSMGGTGTRT
jgi:hypothetical protein